MKTPENLAPHRYRYDVEDIAPLTLGEARQNAPYEKGDIVAIEWNGKLRFALIDSVVADFDRYGDPRAYYRGRIMRADGTFADNFKRQPYFHPGPIQRGYKLAGFAPEMPD